MLEFNEQSDGGIHIIQKGRWFKYIPPGSVSGSRGIRQTRFNSLVSIYEIPQENLAYLQKNEAGPLRYVFVDQDPNGINHWFTAYGNLEDAHEAYNRDSDPEEWKLVRIVDLDTGRNIKFEQVTKQVTYYDFTTSA